jgi:D-lactate dehydrogenase
MIDVAFYDTRPYDVEHFDKVLPADIRLHYHKFRLSADSAATAKGCQAVCAFVSDTLDRPCLEALKNQGVRHVALRCAGYNNIDLAAAKELGLTVTRVPAYSPHAVAEHALALLLCLNRKIHRAHNRVRELNFSLAGLVGFDLFSKTAGVVGTGKIGKIACEIFKGFGMKVVAFDLHRDEAWAKASGVAYVNLDELLKLADVISLHIPLTPETDHMINAQTLAQMKPGAYLINTSRGKLIDTTALIDALKSRKLGGVGLDVYEEEEGIFYEDLSGGVLPDDEFSRLLTFPNVLITSHQAFLTQEALDQIALVTLQNLARFMGGKPFLEGTQVTA